jgi:hypothetical protein
MNAANEQYLVRRFGKDAVDFCKALAGPRWEAFTPFVEGVDYCGPEGNKALSAIIPDSLFGCDFSIGGWYHDNLFRIGGNEAAFHRANADFRDILQWQVRTFAPATWWGKILWAVRLKRRAMQATWIYFAAVEQGRKYFNFTA